MAGGWLLITGKAPQGLFQVLFGKGQYAISGLQARLFGVLLASPLPVVFTVSLLLALFFGKPQLGVSMGIEVVYDILIAILAIIIARRSRQAATPGPAVVQLPN